MYYSLREHCPEFKLWVLCMDKTTCEILEKLNLPGLYPLPLEEFEQNDEPLLIAKQNRSRVEYYFTCTPSLPLFILNQHPAVDLITYLDADLFFFADPAPLFAEMEGKSIGIISHRFPSRIQDHEKYGIYNVGWLSFRQDETGLECLHWWRNLCLEWCYDKAEEDRFADQKYLNRFPQRYGKDVILNHSGANVAPWNIENYNLNIKESYVYVDDQPLLFFHFQGFRQIIPYVYDWGLWDYGIKIDQKLMDYIYMPYIQEIHKTSSGKLSMKTIRNAEPKSNFHNNIKNIFYWCLMFIKGIYKRKFSIIINGKVMNS